MSSVNVHYNFRAFRVKVETNTHLQNVLDQSITHFGLNGELNAQTRYRFLHNNKPVPLDLPWRLLNLPAGARLDLDKVESPACSNGNQQLKMDTQQIKVRFQVNNGYGSILDNVGINEKFGEVLKRVASRQQWSTRDSSLPTSAIKVQIFSKMATVEELENQTLHELGIHSSISVRIILPDPDTQIVDSIDKQKGDQAIVVEEKEEEQDFGADRTQPAVKKSPNLGSIKDPKVYIPPQVPIVEQLRDNPNGDEDEDNAYELTVEQARKYQQMLSNRAGTLGGPLMTKRLREELERERKPPANTVRECQVRIKFPDLSFLELFFKPDDTMETVYSKVASLLVDETWDFKLSETHPHRYLARDTQGSLHGDLKFGAKSILLFEPVQGPKMPTAPFLKSSIMATAEELSLRHEVNSSSDKSADIPNGSRDKTELPKGKAKKLTPGKLPKWFKVARK